MSGAKLTSLLFTLKKPYRHQMPPALHNLTLLQVIPALETGGAERTTLEVARAVVAAGGRSLVASEGGPMVAQLEREGSRHLTLPLASKAPRQMWQNRGALLEIIRTEQVSLIHARSRAPAWSALWAARAANIPFVTTYHGIYQAKGPLKRLYNSAMARGDRVIANSAYTAATVKAAYGGARFFDTARLVVIPRGADLSRFDPEKLTKVRKSKAFLALGGGDAFRILLPGRLTEWKGQASLIKAAGLLQRSPQTPPFRIVLVGSAQGRDGYEADLRAQMEAAGVADRVHIHGHWEDMPVAFDWADVTVSASIRPEAFGRIAVEAQAMGCPVIATAHGGALETVDPGKTGLLVPPGDVEALAAALKTMMAMPPAQRHAMATAARARIESHFSIETMTAATLSVYKDLVTYRRGAMAG